MSMPAWVPVSDWLHSTLKLNCDLIASHFPSQCQFIYEHQFISVNVDSMIWAINKSRIEHVAWFFKLSMAVFQSQRHLAWPPWDRARRLRKWKGRLWVQAWKFYLKSVIDTNSHWHRPMIDISFWSVTFIYAHLILLVTQTQCPVNVQRLNHVHLSRTVLFLWWQETLLMFKPSPWMWTCWPMSRGHGSIWCSSLAGDEDHELN